MSHAHNAAGEVTLLLVGDTNLQNRKNPADAFRLVQGTLREADVVFGHLEGPFCPPNPDGPDVPFKPNWRHSDPAMADGLAAAGFAGVSLASNVTYGPQAISSTLEVLERIGVAACGAGRNLEEARRPAIVERKGVRFGFLSYTSVFWPVGHAAGQKTPGVATIKATTAYQPHPRVLEMPGAPAVVRTHADPDELEAMQEDVRILRQRVDIVVLSCHWGVSSSPQFTEYQQVIGRTAIDAGADLVLGHHPHVLQPIEVYRGRPIFYGMGNFAFDWERMRHKHHDGLLVRCTIQNQKLTRVSYVPARRNAENLIELHRPDGIAGCDIVKRMRELCVGIGTEFLTKDAEVVVVGVGETMLTRTETT